MTTLDHVLSIVTAVVTVFSALASALNHVVRVRQTEGKPVAQALLGGAAVANLAAVNVDKAIQLVKLFRGLPVAHTKSADANTSDAQ